MKNIILIFTLALVLIACNKPLPDLSNLPFSYSVTGIQDVTVPANDAAVFNPSVNLLSGDPRDQPITVTFTGMPKNIIISNNDSSFRLNYSLNSTFYARNAPQGKYPMQVIFTDKNGNTKVYNFNLIITAPLDRVAMFSGYYYPSNACTNALYISCTVQSDASVPNKVLIFDYLNGNTYDTTYAIVDCCSNTFTIPSQKVSGATVTGDGTFSGGNYPYKRAELNRTIVTDTATYYCTVTLEQE
jgi:hypothetical protein